MHKLTLLALFSIALPSVAHAGFVIEVSGGRGMQVAPGFEPSIGRTNIMVAPGWGLGEMIRAELGIVGDLAESGSATTPDQDFNLRLRPMLVIDPPILPLYGRLIVGVTNLTDDPSWEFGGAAGVGVSLGGLGLFAEVGVLPQSVAGEFIWLLEGRAGAQIFFD